MGWFSGLEYGVIEVGRGGLVFGFYHPSVKIGIDVLKDWPYGVLYFFNLIISSMWVEYLYGMRCVCM